MKKLLAIVMMMSLPLFASAGDPNRPCPLVVVALVKVKPGTENAFKAKAKTILAPTRKEAGNIFYSFNQSTQDSTVFDTYEQWKSAADLDAHMKTPHMQAFFTAVGGFFEAGYPVIHTLNNIECQ